MRPEHSAGDDPATGRVRSGTAGVDQARIAEVRIAAAHEGDAELVVTLRHGNGGRSEVALDRFATQALLKACAVTNPDALIGVGWQAVRDALSQAYSRFQPDSE